MTDFIEVDGIRIDANWVRRIRGQNNVLDTRCQALSVSLKTAQAKAQCDQKLLVDALEKYDEAFSNLFGQCASNGVFNAWGRQVDVSLVNDAHELGNNALKAAKAKPERDPAKHPTEEIMGPGA